MPAGNGPLQEFDDAPERRYGDDNPKRGPCSPDSARPQRRRSEHGVPRDVEEFVDADGTYGAETAAATTRDERGSEDDDDDSGGEPVARDHGRWSAGGGKTVVWRVDLCGPGENQRFMTGADSSTGLSGNRGLLLAVAAGVLIVLLLLGLLGFGNLGGAVGFLGFLVYGVIWLAVLAFVLWLFYRLVVAAERIAGAQERIAAAQNDPGSRHDGEN